MSPLYFVLEFPVEKPIVKSVANWLTLSMKLRDTGFNSILSGPIVTENKLIDCVNLWEPWINDDVKYISFSNSPIDDTSEVEKV